VLSIPVGWTHNLPYPTDCPFFGYSASITLQDRVAFCYMFIFLLLRDICECHTAISFQELIMFIIVFVATLQVFCISLTQIE